MNPPRVFLCYARNDNEADTRGSAWRDRLMLHLRPFEANRRFSIFFDEYTETGDEWHKRIQQEIGACDIAVLMISARFLDSDYIRQKEIRNCSGLKVHAMGIDVVKNLTGRSIRGAMDGSGAIEAKVF
jgi:hypothetical protein